MRWVKLTLPPRPDLSVSNVSVGAVSTYQDGRYVIPVTYTVTNSGGVGAPGVFYDYAYLSSDGVLDNADTGLSGSHTQVPALAAGASYTTTVTFNTTAAQPSGSYTLIVKADGGATATSSAKNADTAMTKK